MQLFLSRYRPFAHTNFGKYALICDEQVFIHDTAAQAIEAGSRYCEGTNEFLVAKIEPLSDLSQQSNFAGRIF